MVRLSKEGVVIFPNTRKFPDKSAFAPEISFTNSTEEAYRVVVEIFPTAFKFSERCIVTPEISPKDSIIPAVNFCPTNAFWDTSNEPVVFKEVAFNTNPELSP